MGKRDYIFDGFISYRHAELDKFVAERLQKSLEGFKIPRRANEKAKTNGKDNRKIHKRAWCRLCCMGEDTKVWVV